MCPSNRRFVPVGDGGDSKLAWLFFLPHPYNLTLALPENRPSGTDWLGVPR